MIYYGKKYNITLNKSIFLKSNLMSLSVPNANGTWVFRRSQCGQRPGWKWSTTCFNKQITAVVGCGYSLCLEYISFYQKKQTCPNQHKWRQKSSFYILSEMKSATPKVWLFGILRTSIRYHLGKWDKSPHLTCLCLFWGRTPYFRNKHHVWYLC